MARDIMSQIKPLEAKFVDTEKHTGEMEVKTPPQSLLIFCMMVIIRRFLPPCLHVLYVQHLLQEWNNFFGPGSRWAEQVWKDETG